MDRTDTTPSANADAGDSDGTPYRGHPGINWNYCEDGRTAKTNQLIMFNAYMEGEVTPTPDDEWAYQATRSVISCVAVEEGWSTEVLAAGTAPTEHEARRETERVLLGGSVNWAVGQTGFWSNDD